MKRDNKNNLVLASMFLSIGFVLPLFTMQIKEIGDTLLPMHLPVMLCGLICGANYGGLIGLLLPFLRSVVFGMPPLFPNAVWMAFELATYGFVIGFLFSHFKNKNIYISLIPSMVAGRIVWGVSKALLLGISGKQFTFTLFLAGGFADAWPGIILQLVLIPLIIKILKKRGMII